MRDLSTAFQADDSTFHPLMVSVPLRVAGEVLHVGRSKLYDLLGAGKLRAVKDGTRVMVLIDSIKAYQATLPVAKFAPPKARDIPAEPNRNIRRRRRNRTAQVTG